MPHDAKVSGQKPTRDEIDQLPGPVVLEFGADWCGHCAVLRPHLKSLLKDFPQVRHLRIEDGKGKPLGRSFKVKLWPTLVFLVDGHIVRQAVRPSPEQTREGLEAITSGYAAKRPSVKED